MSAIYRTALVSFLLGLLLPLACSAEAPQQEALTARQIMDRATAAAGGDAWRLASTIRLQGDATLYRDGRAVAADDYRMYRVYPRALDAAHTTTGKFRLDAQRADAVLFSISYDGEQMYDQNGPMDPAAAERLAASSFGYSAARFALNEGFELSRMPDDDIGGQPGHFLRVTDPSGTDTLFGIDADSYAIRLVAWETPQGWHQRTYSNFYWLDNPGFLQPGRVRLYYDGIKTADINWRTAQVDTPMADELFVLGPPQKPAP